MSEESHLEIPQEFHSSNYHGIEYLHSHDSNLYMKTCGVQRCFPGYSYPHNGREGYHLHVVLAGHGTLRVRGVEYPIHGGQMFLLKEGEDCEYTADEQDPWYYVWITYCGKRARRCMEQAGFTDGIFVLDCHVDPSSFLDVIKHILEKPHMKVSSEFYRMSLALRFLSLAVESRERGMEDNGMRDDLTADDYVNYAVEYIRANYSSIRISQVSEYVGINRTYFTSIFKKRMLMSPQEYLMQVRINKGKELLRTTALSVRAVAQEVGYEDQLAFSKLFRKKTGFSPEQYRKEILLNEHNLS